MGILAEQLIKGMSITVSLRSRRDERVRDDMMAGTEQPNPTSSGTMLRPDSPTRRSSLSVTKATRAIYPLSSSRLRKKKSRMMMGTKLATAPTPLMTPSTTSDCTTSDTPQRLMALVLTTPSHAKNDSSSPCRGPPNSSIER